ISSALIVVGLAIALIGGLKFGVDFTGGRSYIVEFSEAIPADEIKTGLDAEFDGSVEAKTYGSNNVLKVTTSYLINEDSDEANLEVEQKVKEGIATITGRKFIEDPRHLDDTTFAITGSSKVGATVANDIKTSS